MVAGHGPLEEYVALVDVLIPTCNRKTGLAIVLAGLLGQTFSDFDVVVSDQSEDGECPLDSIEIATLVRALEWHGHRVTLHRHLPRRGMAEQRHFLLCQSTARFAHFLDDDIVLGPRVMERMLKVITDQQCGFVGCPATGLDYLHDERPHQQRIEVWDGSVRPEPFAPDYTAYERHLINNAANPLHLEQQLVHDDDPVLYKVSWVGGANVLYDREKLWSVGGFSWWKRLPREHAGEEVVAQWLLIRKYGGCGILPARTYHLGLPTNVDDRTRNATELFGELIEEYDVQPEYEIETRPARDQRSEVPVTSSGTHGG